MANETKTGTEKALEQAQELLRTLLDDSGTRETEATSVMTSALDSFLAAYGVDGETDLSGYKGGE